MGEFGRIKGDLNRAEVYAQQIRERAVSYVRVEVMHWGKVFAAFILGALLGMGIGQEVRASGMTANANYNPASVTITGGTINAVPVTAIQNSNAVAITGGTIGGITSLGVNGNIAISGANALRGSYGGGGITTNFASGDSALLFNTLGFDITANGVNALYSNTIGNDNTANGVSALYYNTTGHHNTANGVNALYSNTTGGYNTANGVSALSSNTTGNDNVANGFQTGYTVTPANANVTGSYNTWIGYQSGPGVVTQLNNATAIGNGALNTASNQVVLGNSAVTSNVIYGGLTLNSKLLFSATAPTIASGFGTGATIAEENGTASFRLSFGSGAFSNVGYLTFPSGATTGYHCTWEFTNGVVANTTYQFTIVSNTSVQVSSYNATTAASVNFTNALLNVNCTGV